MPKQVYHKAGRLELREEMGNILFNELLLDQSDEARAEFASLMKKAVKAHPSMDMELSALEDACTGYGVQMAEAAFVAGLEVASDPSRLWYKPDDEQGGVA